MKYRISLVWEGDIDQESLDLFKEYEGDAIDFLIDNEEAVLTIEPIPPPIFD